MKIKPQKKTYESEKLVIEWQPSVCIHSEKCWRGLPDVFRRNEKPWVNVEGADDERIKEQLDRCPSGALSGYWKDQEKQENSEPAAVEIIVSENGPLLIKGKISLKYANGKVEKKAKTTALCRCGTSSNKPFCDGSHQKTGFKG